MTIKIHLPPTLFTQRAAARECGFKSDNALKHYILTGVIPPPEYAYGKRKYYTAADIEELKAFFSVRDKIVKH